MCSSESENLNHFLLQCPAYATERNKILETERFSTVEEEDLIAELLLNEEVIEKTRPVIYEMWKKRKKKRKTLDATN